MKTIAVVPIKLNNERLPGKNIKPLGGKPLIAYCLETLRKIAEIDEIYVYCSNKEIGDYLPEDVELLLRPQELDLPSSNFTQIFTKFIERVDADIYVYAHATAPFLKAETISRGLNAVISGKYDSAFCAQKIQDFLWQNGEPLNFNAANIPRSQDLPIVWRETSGVYILRKEVFDKYKRRIGAAPLVMEVDMQESVDINTHDDFRLAELLLNY